MKFNEHCTIENHIIEFIREKLGYEYIPSVVGTRRGAFLREYIKSDAFAKFRDLESEYIIKPLLEQAIKKNNSDVSDDEVMPSIT